MAEPLSLFVFFGAWIAIGVAVAIVMGRRGHSPTVWLVFGAGLGPLAFLAARASVLNEPQARTVLGQCGTPGRGPVNVLVGVDGSEDSLHALDFVLQILGSRVGHLAIATVVDYDAALSSDDAADAEEILATAASKATAIARCVPDTVTLVGRPGAALLEHTRDGGFHLLVIGRRGRGLSRMVFGSVAKTVAESGTVPVVIVGPDAVSPVGDTPETEGAATA